MRKLNTREKVLLGILVAGAIAAYFGLRGNGLGFGGAVPTAKEIPPVGDPPVVRMDLLAQKAVSYDPGGRDLFKYYVPPKKPVVRPARPATPAPVRQERPKPPPPPPKAEPRGPRPPTPDFTYLGFLGPKEDRIAVFDDGTELLLARVGDVVEGQFELVEFKFETVVMGFRDERFKGRTTELKMSTK